jgi:Ca2+-binding EF-hand superfamily protein
MTLKTLKIGLFSIAICATMQSYAQKHHDKDHKKRNPETLFKKLDSDSNGSLSFEEFTTRKKSSDVNTTLARKKFDLMDTNTDNSISLEEFVAQRDLTKEERIAQRFALMDSDSNGSVDLEEYTAFVETTKTRRKKRKHRKYKKED